MDVKCLAQRAAVVVKVKESAFVNFTLNRCFHTEGILIRGN